MTKAELERRATFLEGRLDNDRFYSEDEEELCAIYGMLMKMNQLEAQ